MSELSAPSLAILDELRTHELLYTANDAINRALGRRTVMPLIAPTGIGKTTVIQKTCEIDSEFYEVQGFTTRDRRPNEKLGEFRAFYPHNDESIRFIKELYDAGKLVQYTVHRDTGFIYGSTLEDYGPKFNMLPILSTNVEQFSNLSFHAVTPVALICTVEEWEHRFGQRATTMDPVDVAKRLTEATRSLQWSLAQADLPWVHNRQNKLEHTAEQLIAIAHSPKIDTEGPRNLGKQLLAHIERNY